MKNIPFCTRLAVFIAVFVVLPLSIVLAAGSYSISNEYFVDDTDHARHFYRIPITPEGNPIEFGDFGFTSGLFLYGYGYSVFNGITNFGYGYGYGYNHYADNSTGLDDGNMRLGFFINPEAGETYDTVTLPYSEQAETRIVTVPFALPIILTESGNDGVYIRPGTNGLTITGDETWDGSLAVDVLDSAEEVDEDYSDLVALFDDVADFFVVQVRNTTGSPITLSDEAFVNIPTAFDAETQSVYLSDTTGNTEEVFACTELEFTGDAEVILTVLDPDYYNLADTESECYVYVEAMPMVVVATRHFTAFAVGELAEEESGESGGSSSSSSGGGSRPGESTVSTVFPFTDVDSSYFAKDYIQVLFDKGIISGKSAMLFAPNDSVSRAEFVKMVMIAFGYEIGADNTVATKFLDVKPTDWFAKYVETATRLGIVMGYTDGTFKPNQEINRAEALKVLLMAAKVETGNQSIVTGFLDVKSTDWFSKYVEAAFKKGIVSGKTTSVFDPAGFMTRGEAAKVLVKTMELNK